MEVFKEDNDIGDVIEQIVPKYLYREQYHKCKTTLEEIFLWTGDSFYHSMHTFHERVLYGFICYMSDLEEEIDEADFRRIYFDETTHRMVAIESRKRYEELKADFEEDDFTFEEYEQSFYDPHCYEDELFEDEDFLLIDQLYNNWLCGNSKIEEIMGINLDYYFDLLPLDIQERYKTKHITLVGEVEGLLKYINDRVHYGSLYKLFWEKDVPVNENRVQLILENIMDAYFFNQEVDITREAVLANGKVDFKLYKSHEENEKVLIEVKMAKSAKLKSGYEKQLMDYIQSANYKIGFYLIACFSDEEIEKSKRFIEENVYTDTYCLYLNISILDLRKRRSSSTL